MLLPTATAPARVQPGGLLSFVIEAASGLTPPPGLQEDRAHRWFAVSLCARGLPLGAAEQRCFPLRVRNVRPLDGASLTYRVEAPVPRWVAPWSYDLAVRFPGGHAQLRDGVRVGGAQPAREPAELRREHDGWSVAAPADQLVRLRLHVGANGLDAGGARFEAYPLPDAARGLQPGFVALLTVPRAARVRVRQRPPSAAPPLRILFPEAEAGRAVTLRAEGAQGSVFWWLDAERGASGAAVTTRFVLRGVAPVEVLEVSADGRTRHARAEVAVVARQAFGCSLARGAGALELAGLLGFALSWKLVAGLRPARGSGSRRGRE